MEYVEELESYNIDLFSNSFKEVIDKTKKVFENHREYIIKPIVKCFILGNTSSGKSTVLNALLEDDILYEGIPEGTLCGAICQSSSNNDEYFKFYEGSFCLDKKMKISDIKNINLTNPNHSKFSMNVNNYLDIYLNVSNHEILNKILLYDCPGFNVENLDAIIKYCYYADIIIFCYNAENGITDYDINKINRIKSKIGNFQISFIINHCDKCDAINREAMIKKLSPHLTGEDSIFFISAREEKRKTYNNARHREFEQFKMCLQKQKSLAAITYKKVYLDLICSVKGLLDCLHFTNFREYRFMDRSFTELQKQIKRLINNDKSKYCKDESYNAFSEYSDKTNKEISNFITKQFIRDHHLKDGIIDNDYFYKIFIQNDAIEEPTFSWYEWGDKKEKMKKCFLHYFTVNLTRINSDIEGIYSERAQTFLNELRTYKNELNVIIENINKLVF